MVNGHGHGSWVMKRLSREAAEQIRRLSTFLNGFLTFSVKVDAAAAVVEYVGGIPRPFTAINFGNFSLFTFTFAH